MRPSDCKAVGLLRLLAGLYTVALCRAGTTATRGSITTRCKAVRFPLRHDSQEKLVMSRLNPNIGILGWKSSSPEYPHIVISSYKDRIIFRRDAFIELRDVGPGDQGTYEISYYGRKLFDRDLFELRVVEPMSTPTVGVSCNSSHLTLNCFTVSGCSVTYQWERRSQDPGVGNATFPRAIMRLLNTGQHNNTCIAEDCCSSHAVTAKLLCHTPLGGSWTGWMIAAVVLIPVVVLILAFSLHRWRVLKQKTMQFVASFRNVKSSVHSHSELDSNSVEQQQIAFLQANGIEEGNNNIEACHPPPQENKSDKPAIVVI
ncbi:uncharacterized protein LOC116981362 [Amblyraja radiata]|uniref:uncharacterized protein LOC116981362 n=1 Tax=Amblyraja radiata TaxID=386614 RepID=UPI001403EA5E|nr:uncharacterized protein LOC116981362 [Amblyraja radiata]